MKRILAIVVALLMIQMSFAFAEDMDLSTFTDAELDGLERAIEMEREARASADAAEEGESAAPEEYAALQNGSRGDLVKAVQQKLKELGFSNSEPDGIFGPKTEKALRDLQAAFKMEVNGIVATQEEFDAIMALEAGDGINLATRTSSEWSDWMSPEYNEGNKYTTFTCAYLGEKEVGDTYTCQLEIEFKNVKPMRSENDNEAFLFCTQGPVDGDWYIGNIWNSNLVRLKEAPKNGVYKYTYTTEITEKMVDAARFDLGFRCDYWADGSYRVRKIKVEKGPVATEWSLRPGDVGDGVNLAKETSNEWSEWMTPEYYASNRSFELAYADLGEKSIGDTFTCQVEVEFEGVSAAQSGEAEGDFLFQTQGAVDGDWHIGNIWNNNLIKLTEAPEDGVVKYVYTASITDKLVDASRFSLGFRCDNWASGSFRVRCIKVERGMKATVWSPSL